MSENVTFVGGGGTSNAGGTSILNGQWSKGDGSWGLIINGNRLTQGESVIYRKLIAIEAMLKDIPHHPREVKP